MLRAAVPEGARHAQPLQRRLAGHQPALRRLVLPLRQLARRCPIPDIDRTDYFLCIGANPLVSNGSVDDRARRARRAARDPRARRQASSSSIRAAPRPRARPTSTSRSAPAATPRFLLAMVQARDRRARRVDACRVDAHRDRLGRGRARASRALTPDAAPRVTRASPPTTIERLAREFADAPSRRSPTRASASATTRFGTLATCATDLLNLVAGRLGADGGAMFTTPAFDVVRVLAHARRATATGAGAAACAGCPRRSATCPPRASPRRSRRRATGQIRALVTLRRQPGALDAERPAPRRGAREARLHGLDRPLRQRDDAARRRDPAAGVGAGRGPRRPAVRAVRGAQRRALVAAGGRAAGRTSAPTGRSCSSSPSASAAARPAWRRLDRALSRRRRLGLRWTPDRRSPTSLLRTGPLRRPLPAVVERASTCAKLARPHARHRSRSARAGRRAARLPPRRQGPPRRRAVARRPMGRARRVARDARAGGRAPADRPARAAQQQLVDAQRAGAGLGPRALRALRASRRRGARRRRATATIAILESRVHRGDVRVQLTDEMRPASSACRTAGATRRSAPWQQRRRRARRACRSTTGPTTPVVERDRRPVDPERGAGARVSA